MFIPTLQMGNEAQREIHGHTASPWQNQNQNPRRLGPKSILYITPCTTHLWERGSDPGASSSTASTGVRNRIPICLPLNA